MNKQKRYTAIMGLEMERTVEPPQRCRILFEGLILNHPRNVALVHPVLFMARRLILAITVVFMEETRHWGVFLTLIVTLAMLAYTVIERPWQDHYFVRQEIVNELVLYILCLLTLCFCHFESSLESRETIGTVFSCLFFVCAFSNLAVIVFVMLRHLKLVLRR